MKGAGRRSPLRGPLGHSPETTPEHSPRSPLSYKQRGDKKLLHGVLHIKIFRCKDLRNMDGIRGLRGVDKMVPGFIKRDVSDPFVSVRGGKHRFAKTSLKMNDLNPVWNEEFYCQVGHYLSFLKFDVKDKDFGATSELIGTHHMPVEDLIKYDPESGRPLRVGLHKIALLDGKKSHGSLEYFIEFIPKEMMTSKVEVPGVYFHMRSGNQVKLYVNADDGAEGLPTVTYGGANDNEKVWKPQRLWRDMYDSICEAKHFIYITGWSIDTTQSLLRGQEREDALKSKYSPNLGELLVQKAEEGVTVNMLVWDDSTSNDNFKWIMPGMMGTHDEESNNYFRHSKVTFKLAPMLGDDTNALYEKLGKFVMFTHHQKLVILDAPSEDGCSALREPLAFVGGLDLTNGRWDNHKHPLFRTLGTDHKGDAYSKCFPVDVEKVGPRQPWRDIHSSVRGHGVLDVLENFTERWLEQAKDEVSKLLDMGDNEALSQFAEEGLANSRCYGDWYTQLFRSIDARTASFQRRHMVQAHVGGGAEELDGESFHENEMKPESVVEDDGKMTKFGRKMFARAEGKSNRVPGLKSKAAGSRMVGGLVSKAEGGIEKIRQFHQDAENLRRSFATPDIDSFQYRRMLYQKKGRDVDDSVHTGMVHHIRRAEHCLYIESQYFLGSSHLWSDHDATKCGNLIPSEVALKILEKIEAGERFAAYIVLPMWPEGIPEGNAVQAILYWQRHTMESMYRRIGEALAARRTAVREGSIKGISPENIAAHPQDYLNFYCLATRESPEGSAATAEPRPKSAEELLHRTRRHQIYVHSKMLIVDDTVALIGSANVNQRSLDGTRDSEVVLGSYQLAHMATRESIPRGDVHGFRMHCWTTAMGTFEDAFRRPSSLECVRRVNAIAEENWRTYTAEECQDMDSYLVPYPIKVEEDGTVRARPELKDGCFPDTKAKVLGTKSMNLPEILTT